MAADKENGSVKTALNKHNIWSFNSKERRFAFLKRSVEHGITKPAPALFWWNISNKLSAVSHFESGGSNPYFLNVHIFPATNYETDVNTVH